ncbi:hypothetical protein HN587_07805 [Candidatus Woesearchaeota archaeon]|jgi:hypothetical protein|nr:hypothetical protein [Candidatus Woesearchaeota archaeon]
MAKTTSAMKLKRGILSLLVLIVLVVMSSNVFGYYEDLVGPGFLDEVDTFAQEGIGNIYDMDETVILSYFVQEGLDLDGDVDLKFVIWKNDSGTWTNIFERELFGVSIGASNEVSSGKLNVPLFNGNQYAFMVYFDTASPGLISSVSSYTGRTSFGRQIDSMTEADFLPSNPIVGGEVVNQHIVTRKLNEALRVGLVVGNPSSPDASYDVPFYDKLTGWGYDVIYIDDSNISTTDYLNYDVAIVSESVGSLGSDPGSKLRTDLIPVLLVEAGFKGLVDSTSTEQFLNKDDVDIYNNSHIITSEYAEVNTQIADVTTHLNYLYKSDFLIGAQSLIDKYGSPSSSVLAVRTNETVNVRYSFFGMSELDDLNSDGLNLFSRTFGWTRGGCTIPYAGMVITEDTLLCPGEYNLSGGSNPYISISAANVDLICDGTVIIGIKSDTGIQVDNSSADDVSILGCTLKNFNQAIAFNWPSGDIAGTKIYYNFINNSNYGIFFNDPAIVDIYDNTITYCAGELESSGIKLHSGNTNATINGNNLNNNNKDILVTPNGAITDIYLNNILSSGGIVNGANTQDYCGPMISKHSNYRFNTSNEFYGNYYGLGVSGYSSNCANLTRQYSAETIYPVCAVDVIGNLTLDQDLVNYTGGTYCSDNGLNFGANEATIDCGGYSIKGLSGSYLGVNLYITLMGDYNYTTLANCNISGFSRGVRTSIYDYYFHLINNTIWNNSVYGVDGVGPFALVENNFIFNNSNGGISLGSDNVIITNNTLVGDLGIYSLSIVGGVNNLNVINNTFYEKAISFGGTSTNSLIYGNNFISNSSSIFGSLDEALSFNSSNQGNFYSFYDSPREGCYDSDNNLICDSEITFSGSVDYLPSNYYIGDCTVPVEDLAIEYSVILCNDTYNINTTSSTGVVDFQVSNVSVYCNDTRFISDDTPNSRGIRFYELTGVQIKGCSFDNYYSAFYSTNSNYLNMVDNFIINSSSYPIYFENTSNSQILSNEVRDGEVYGIFFTGDSENNNLSQNLIVNHGSYGFIIWDGSSGNSIWANNFIDNNPGSYQIGQKLSGSNNYNLSDLGNFYSDYDSIREGCDDLDDDLICDDEYDGYSYGDDPTPSKYYIGDCTPVVDSLDIYYSVILCANTYNIDSTVWGIFDFKVGNVSVYGNNSILNGDGEVEDDSAIFLNSGLEGIQIKNLTMQNYGTGIELSSASFNVFDSITIVNTTYGNAYYSSLNSFNNSIINSIILGAADSQMIRLHQSPNTLFSHNLVKNGVFGIVFDDSADSVVLGNNFINISTPILGSNVVLNDSNQGNFYSDYDSLREGCIDNNNNLVCDSVRVFGSLTDYLPSNYYVGDCKNPDTSPNIEYSVILCNDTYPITTDSSSGVVDFLQSNLSVYCNDTVFTGAGVGNGFYLNNLEGIHIKNCNLTNYQKGVYLINTPFSKLEQLWINDSALYGVTTSSSHYLEIYDSIFEFNSDDAIYLSGTDNSIFSNLTFRLNQDVSNDGSVYIASSDNNKLFNLTFLDNLNAGVNFVVSSDYNNVSDSLFSDFDNYALMMAVGSDNNLVWNNNFVNNSETIRNLGVNNNFNLSNQGNFYSDYDSPREGCLDTNNNLVCDSSLSFGSSLDNYPNNYYIDSCTTPVENLSINYSLIFCPGTYNFNNYLFGGVLNLTTGNTSLYCNNTIFDTNGSTDSVIDQDDIEGIHVKSCTFQNYDSPLNFDNITDLRIENNVIMNASSWAIYAEGSDQIITNNVFNNSSSVTIQGDHWSSDPIIFEDALNVNISNNLFDVDSSISISNAINPIIYGNNLSNFSDQAILLYSIDGGNISNNNLEGTGTGSTGIINIVTNCSEFGELVSNLVIYDNNISFVQAGIGFMGARNNSIYGNHLYNITRYGIFLAGCSSNNSFEYNNISGRNPSLYGLFLMDMNESFENNSFLSNDFSDFLFGVYSYNISDFNQISNNSFQNITDGLYLFNGENFNISRNKIYASNQSIIFDSFNNSNVWLNHFYSGLYAVKENGTTAANEFCVLDSGTGENEGNFYYEDFNSSTGLSASDCGPLNITIPGATQYHSSSVDLNWTKQSGIYSINYYVYWSNVTDVWNLDGTTADLNYTMDTSSFDEGSYDLKIVPLDLFATINGTHDIHDFQFIIDTQGPTTTDNISDTSPYVPSRYWYMDDDPEILLNATDTLSGVHYTYYCNYSIYDSACDTEFGDNNTNLIEQTNLTTEVTVFGVVNSTRQWAINYYSEDYAGNREIPTLSEQINVVWNHYIQNTSWWNSTIENIGSIINNSDVNNSVIRDVSIIKDSLIQYSLIENDALIVDSTIVLSNLLFVNLTNSILNNSNVTALIGLSSNIQDSTIINCTVTNSNITNSTLKYVGDYDTPCVIEDSIIEDSIIYNSVINNSFIDPTTIIDSRVENSNVTNSYLEYSFIRNSIFCDGFSLYAGVSEDSVLISGRIEYGGNTYYSPYSFANICGVVAPVPVGDFSVDKSIVKTGDLITFSYDAGAVGYTVTFDGNPLRNYTYTLNDFDHDGIYEKEILVMNANNLEQTFRANVNDNKGNTFQSNPVTVTLDNTNPTGSISITGENGSSTITGSPNVMLQLDYSDSNGINQCRFANDNFEALQGAINFTQFIINGSFDYARDVNFGDLDGDGDIDVLGVAYQNDSVVWWENDGTESFTQQGINESFDGAEYIEIVDLDGDGDIDVLGSAAGVNDIVWWKNDGVGNFVQHMINDSFSSAAGIVDSVDLDGDGDIDIIGNAVNGDDIVWWENDGDENFVQHIINNSFELFQIFEFELVDLDDDTDYDIIGAVASEDLVVWWENDGDENFVSHTINDSFISASAVNAVDLDFDGDLDILGTAGMSDDVVWWENDGSESFTQHDIDTNFNGAKDIESIDLDSDGDLDFFAVAIDDGVAWWENDGNQNFTKHVINSSFNGSFALALVDLDENGYVDILSAAMRDDDIAWWAHNLIAGSEWQECVSEKAWTLSSGFDTEKTVFYQVKDNAGNIETYNATIEYRLIQDYTPPTSVPTVYDGLSGEDIDWVNSNTTLSAHWTNSFDEISETYYRYRLYENGSLWLEFNNGNYTSVGINTSVTVTGLNLTEGFEYKFEVEAYNPYNLSALAAISDGQVVDITNPNSTIIESMTHPDNETSYNNNNPIFNFTAVDINNSGVPSIQSGILGYSYVLDQKPGTAPDDFLEQRYEEELQEMNSNGNSFMLKEDSDVETTQFYSQLLDNFTQNQSLKIKIKLFEEVEDLREDVLVQAYVVRFDDYDADLDEFNDSDYTIISNVVLLERDIAYSDSSDDADIYSVDLMFNETVSNETYDIFLVISGVVGDENTNNISIGTTTKPSDINQNTKLFYVNQTDDSLVDLTQDYELAIEIKKVDMGNEWEVSYENLADGTYYFHVKTQDNAGNWGNVSHYQFNVDTIGIPVSIISPTSGQSFLSDLIDVVVEVDSSSNVSIISEMENGSVYVSANQSVTSTATFENILLSEGTNELYAISYDENNVSATSVRIFVVSESLTGVVTNKTLNITFPCTGISGSDTHLNYCGPSTYKLGVASEEDSSISLNRIVADTSEHSIKIFMTKPDFDAGSVEDQLDDDEFLDVVSPAFGFRREPGEYLLRTDLRYIDLVLSGDKKVGTGSYKLVIRNNGLTSDGRPNVTIQIT